MAKLTIIEIDGKDYKEFWYSYMKEGKRQTRPIILKVDANGRPLIEDVSLINRLYETEADAEKQTNPIEGVALQYVNS